MRYLLHGRERTCGFSDKRTCVNVFSDTCICGSDDLNQLIHTAETEYDFDWWHVYDTAITDIVAGSANQQQWVLK